MANLFVCKIFRAGVPEKMADDENYAPCKINALDSKQKSLLLRDV